MQIVLEPGNYLVAVSGGVDSVVLLDVLTKLPGLQLTVAHFDHGIREDSVQDAEFVQQLAKNYDLPYLSERVELGTGASEATARTARYDFLRTAQSQVAAQAIVTAHHQDDVLETAIINLQRGTGRRGLTSLASTSDIRRPLLDYSKATIISYAVQQALSWHEDSTNHDTTYTRNYIRHCLLADISPSARQALLGIIKRLRTVNAELDELLSQYISAHNGVDGLDRDWFSSLPVAVASEVMAAWLRQNQLADFDRPTIHRLAAGARSKQSGKQLDIRRGRSMVVKRKHLALTIAER